jgi:hypothetical protein
MSLAHNRYDKSLVISRGVKKIICWIDDALIISLRMKIYILVYVVIVYRPSPLRHQSTVPFSYMFNLFQVPGADIMAV